MLEYESDGLWMDFKLGTRLKKPTKFAWFVLQFLYFTFGQQSRSIRVSPPKLSTTWYASDICAPRAHLLSKNVSIEFH